MTDRLNEICWFCLRDLEVNDGILLCHPCYNIFCSYDSPFYDYDKYQRAFWEKAVSDPDATMWLQKRLENK